MNSHTKAGTGGEQERQGNTEDNQRESWQLAEHSAHSPEVSLEIGGVRTRMY